MRRAKGGDRGRRRDATNRAKKDGRALRLSGWRSAWLLSKCRVSDLRTEALEEEQRRTRTAIPPPSHMHLNHLFPHLAQLPSVVPDLGVLGRQVSGDELREAFEALDPGGEGGVAGLEDFDERWGGEGGGGGGRSVEGVSR